MVQALPFTRSRDGLRLAVRLTPKAAADRIIGVIEDGHGGSTLKATVTAPPVEGEANAALIRLLARHFGLKPRALAVAAGASSRAKIIDVTGDPAALAQRITEGLRPWLTPS